MDLVGPCPCRRGKPRWQAASMTFWGKGQELPLSCPGAAGEGLKDKKAHKHQKCWSSQWPGESQQSTPHRRRNPERVRVRDRLGRWPSAKNQRSLQGSAPVICWVFALASICREGADPAIPGDPDRSNPASLCPLQPAACSLPPRVVLP